MGEFDKGPYVRFARHFDAVPDPPFPDRFWFDWGPVFYRGRLDGSARVLCLGSDPGATEKVAGRTLVGDAGQRVQGFLAKLGVTRSYLCLNAFPYALFPSEADTAEEMLADPTQAEWRNRLYDMATSSLLQAVVAFGRVAQLAVGMWKTAPAVPVSEIPHPSSHDPTELLNEWRDAVTSLRQIVTPDPDGDPSLPNYGSTFEESDYAPIPSRDLPFGVPAFLGDSSWVRAAGGRSSVSRPSPDDRHTLVWKARPS
jgi:Uracil DNA glycosylase superfamily